jgi:flagellar biosynthesis protein FlgN
MNQRAVTADPDGRSLPVQLRAGCELVKAFGELLRAEQQALIDGNVDALAELGRGKANLLEESIRLAAARDDCLRDAGLPAGQPGMESWIAAHPAARAAWGNFLDGARTARELNRANGTLIAIRLGHTNQALAVLLARTSDAGLTYAADGRTNVARASRALGTA